MSGDVKVTRGHRLAALRALGWADASLTDSWPDVGGDTLTRSNKYIGKHVTSMVEESAVALAIATAEHSLRAAVIADLRTVCQCADIVNQGSSVLYVRADSLDLLLETLESQS